MSKNTPEQQAALDSTWWAKTGWEGLRRPLPATDEYPEVLRKCGNINGVTEFWHPPYICALPIAGKVTFDLYGGDGWRIGYDKATDDDSNCTYADSEDMPEAWKEPVRAALEEAKALWPDTPIMLRPRKKEPMPW